MKTLITLIITLVLSNYAMAAKFPGYYIDLEGNKVHTEFKIKRSNFIGEPMLSSIKYKIKYVDNKEVKKLTPDMCKEIGFTIYSGELVFLSLQYNYCPAAEGGINSIFMRRKIQGPVSLYYHYHTSQSSGMGYNGAMYMSQSEAEGWIISKENGQFLKITYGGGKRKDLAEFFADYEELADKIINKDKSVVASNTESLVKLYNSWKLGQEEEQETKEVSDTLAVPTSSEDILNE